MRNLLILDKEEYRSRNQEFIDLMNHTIKGENTVVYTSYEDRVIRKVRNYKYFGSFLQHILYWFKSANYAIKAIRGSYDRIYCINPIVGIFLGMFNHRTYLVVGGFLFEPKKNKFYYLLRKIFTQQSLKGISKILVYSSKETDYYKKIFKTDKFRYVKYGIDFNTPQKYLSTELPEEYIFSGGGSNRDYKTLIDAYNKQKKNKLPLVIATQQWRLQGIDIDDALLLSDVVLENFGDVLRRSKVLILSLKDTEISAGHMVMFQAMSLGIPIIVNEIPAIRDYVSHNEVSFYRSKNSDELADIMGCVNESILNKAKIAKQLYDSELTFIEFLKRVLRC